MMRKNVLLEFDTDQHFVFPKGGGHAIINCLLDHMKKYDGLSIMWETEGVSLLLNDDGSIRGAKVRGTDGRLKSLNAPKVMLSCGGFEGNQEMLSKYVGNKVTTLPLIAPGLVHNKGRGLVMGIDAGAATAGSFDGIHCELVDVHATKNPTP